MLGHSLLAILLCIFFFICIDGHIAQHTSGSGQHDTIVSTDPCSLDGANLICQYYVCNRIDCSSYINESFYSSISAALDSAVLASPPNSSTIIQIIPGNYSESISIKPTLNTVKMRAYTPNPILESMQVIIAGVVVSQRDEAPHNPFYLNLDGITIRLPENNPDVPTKEGQNSQECLKLRAAGMTTVDLDHVSLHCTFSFSLLKSATVSISLKNSTISSFSYSSFATSDLNLSITNTILNSLKVDGNSINSNVFVSQSTIGFTAIYVASNNLSNKNKFEIHGSSFYEDFWLATEGHNETFQIFDSVFQSIATIKMEPKSHVSVHDSIFTLGLTVRSTYLMLESRNCHYYASPSRLNLHSATKVLQCIITGNRFHNGTWALESNDLKLLKNGQSFVQPFIIRNNTFTARHYSTRPFDVIRSVMDPALYITDSTTHGFKKNILVDASMNYWGSPHGPNMCYNEPGKGAYASQYVDVSRFCMDPTCTNVSNMNFPPHFVAKGCPQRMSTPIKAFFFLTYSFGLLFTITSIYFIVRKLRGDTSVRDQSHEEGYESFDSHHYDSRLVSLLPQNQSVEDLIDKTVKTWETYSLLSAIGCIAAMVNNILYYEHVSNIPWRPLQQVISPGLADSSYWSAFLGLMLALNTYGFFLSKIRKHFPKVARYSIKPIYLISVIGICSPIITNLFYLVYQGGHVGNSTFVLPITDPLFVLATSPLVVLCSITIFLPIKTLNDLTFHYEYSKLSKGLDKSLLHHLKYSPKLEKFATKVNLVLIVAFLIALGIVGFEAYNLHKHRAPLLIGARYIENPLFSAFLLGVIQKSFAAACILAAVICTKTAYFRPSWMFMLLIPLLAVGITGIIDIAYWSVYLHIVISFNSGASGSPVVQAAKKVVFTEIGCDIAWLITTITVAIFVHHLRTRALRELPGIIALNLNEHLDAKWNLGVSLKTDRSSSQLD